MHDNMMSYNIITGTEYIPDEKGLELFKRSLTPYESDPNSIRVLVHQDVKEQLTDFISKNCKAEFYNRVIYTDMYSDSRTDVSIFVQISSDQLKTIKVPVFKKVYKLDCTKLDDGIKWLYDDGCREYRIYVTMKEELYQILKDRKCISDRDRYLPDTVDEEFPILFMPKFGYNSLGDVEVVFNRGRG